MEVDRSLMQGGGEDEKGGVCHSLTLYASLHREDNCVISRVCFSLSDQTIPDPLSRGGLGL